MLKHTEIYFQAYIFSVDIYNPETDLKCVRREGGGGGGGGDVWGCLVRNESVRVPCQS